MSSIANTIKLLKTNVKTLFIVFFGVLWASYSSGQIVVIDAGHGYNADCSNGDGRTTTEINTAHEVSLRLHALISANAPQYTVFRTRPNNTCGSWVSISQRASMANNWNADVFLSIHCNAGGGTGTETFWCNQAGSPEEIVQTYAELVQNKMVYIGNWNDRRVVEDQSYLAYHLGVLKNLTMSGSLSEIGFVDSMDSLKLLHTSWRDSFALAYYQAIVEFLNPSSTPILSCDQAIEVYPGILFHGTASTDPSYINSYACNTWTETGPERVHELFLDTIRDITVNISNYQGDLDVYILSSCDASACVGTVYSSSAQYIQAPAGTYYIVVDADDGSGSAYDLFVDTTTQIFTQIQRDNSIESTIQVFPNPVQDQLFVDCKALNISRPTIQVYDMQGRELFPTANWNESIYVIDVSRFSSGIYTLFISSDQNNYMFVKFIKT